MDITQMNKNENEKKLGKGLTIKDLPEQLLANMRKRADGEGRSVQEMIRRLLQREYGAGDAILGWFKRDRPGEVDDRDGADDPPERCKQCGEGLWPASPAWFALIGGSLVGPYCDECSE